MIEVRGKDSASFLHNVLSNDIKSLRPGQETWACLLNAQAKIIAVFHVFCFEDYFRLICDCLLKDKALEHLNKLIIMEDVTLTDKSEVGNKGSAPDVEAERIRAGIPRYGIDFDESTNPLECGLDRAVSLTKGCFPGQEILVRLDSRGGVSKKLYGLVLKGETIPKRNARITKDNVEVGHITSATFDPILKKTIALGYLKRGCWTAGTPVVIENDGIKIPARVESLPFYTPNSS